jgi:FlaA1/EpsC-like NDP-sugar epimerase
MSVPSPPPGLAGPFVMRNRFVLLADVCLIPLAAFAAFALRFDWRFYTYRPEFLFFVIAAVAIKPAVFYWFGMYRRYWRYASLPDMMAVLLASSASLVAMGVFVTARLLYDPELEFARAVLLIDGLLTLTAAAAVRVSVRVLGESRARARETQVGRPVRRVLVVGAGQAGAMVVREMERNRQLGMKPVGFLDDDQEKKGKQIHGVPVLGATSRLPQVVQERRVAEVIIAMPTAPGSQLRSIAEQCRQLNVVSRTVPGVFELLDGNVSVSRLRQIEIADLLRRAQVTPAKSSSSYVAGKHVLVTGAGGSIGAELCRQVALSHPASLILLGHGENSIYDVHVELRERFPGLNVIPVIADIRDMRRMGQLFTQLRPAIVFHAAAHKHVPLMEENPEEAVSNNIIGTHHVLEAALAAGTERFVLISTDKAVAPSSIMGASKRVAEMLVRAAARRTSGGYVVVRFGNVLGSRGSVVPHFKRQIERGGPITLTHPDMTRFFMTIPEAVHLVLEAGGIGRGGELFVLKMGAPVRITDLAQDLIKLSGFAAEEIPIVYTGIRPGEKLDEALWEDGAAAEATSHPDIVRVIETDAATLPDSADIVKAFAAAIQQGDESAVKAMLMQQLPAGAPILKSGTTV